MNQIIKVGPLLLKANMLFFVLGLSLGYLVMNRRYQATNHINSMDDIINGAILWLLVYKFSLVVFKFPSVIKQPLQLIYFTGGFQGFLLACGCGIGFLTYRARKTAVSLWSFIDLLVWGLLTANVVYHLGALFLDPADWAFSSSQIILSLTLLLWLYFKQLSLQALRWDFFLWWGIGEIFVYFLKPHTAVFIGFSQEQLSFLGLALFSLGGQWWEKKRS